MPTISVDFKFYLAEPEFHFTMFQIFGFVKKKTSYAFSSAGPEKMDIVMISELDLKERG